MYAVVLVIPSEKDEVWVICNWGVIFERRLQQLTNPAAVLNLIASNARRWSI